MVYQWGGKTICLPGILCIVTLSLFGLDKMQTIDGGFRVPEIMLHLTALAGGWPGGVLGMLLFRHDKFKARFLCVYGLCAIINMIVILAFYV